MASILTIHSFSDIYYLIVLFINVLFHFPLFAMTACPLLVRFVASILTIYLTFLIQLYLVLDYYRCQCTFSRPVDLNDCFDLVFYEDNLIIIATFMILYSYCLNVLF